MFSIATIEIWSDIETITSTYYAKSNQLCCRIIENTSLNDVVIRVAKQLNKIFTGISATVALTPKVAEMFQLILQKNSLLVLVVLV